MSDTEAALSRILPGQVPPDDNSRLLVHMMRRMAIGGLDDALAAAAAIGWFGLRYRRPLILARALMAEIARVSARVIQVAPPCCPRMTADELTLLCAILDAGTAPHAAHAELEQLTATPRCLGVLSSAQALEQAFRDLGRPLGGFDL